MAGTCPSKQCLCKSLCTFAMLTPALCVSAQLLLRTGA